MRKILLLAAILITSCQANREADTAGSSEREARGVEGLLGSTVLPDRDQKKLIVERAVADELEDTLETLPGVESARAHVTLADDSLMSRDRNAPSTAAVVLVLESERGPGEGKVARIVEGAVEGIERENISVETAVVPGGGDELVMVGPLAVASSSATAARILLAALLVACLLLAAGLIYAGLRLRRFRSRGPQHEPDA